MFDLEIENDLFQSTLSLRRATSLKGYDCPECKFQSTLSLRRATPSSPFSHRRTIDFNPRSPCGERLRRKYIGVVIGEISIHALLAESDSKYHQIGPIVSV